MKTALLLSGGIDSTALAYLTKPDIAITINYGQACADAEMLYSSIISKSLGIPHEVIHVDCSSLGSGDLVNKAQVANAPASEWWPFRNQLLITLSLMRLFPLNISRLLIGTVASDNYHADGTRLFISAIDALSRVQEGGIHIEAPAIDLTSIDFVYYSKVPPSLLGWTHSCHSSNFACGLCRGCEKHRHIEMELGYDFYKA